MGGLFLTGIGTVVLDIATDDSCLILSPGPSCCYRKRRGNIDEKKWAELAPRDDYGGPRDVSEEDRA